VELIEGCHSEGDSFVIAKGIPSVAKLTPVSLGYPLSVLNENSTLKNIYLIFFKERFNRPVDPGDLTK